MRAARLRAVRPPAGRHRRKREREQHRHLADVHAVPRRGSIQDAFEVDMTIVGLSSNEGDGAEKPVQAVFDGIAACAGGFGIAAEGGPCRQHRLHVLHGRLRHAGQRKAATVPTTALDAQVAELK
ncbi:hypothetical protein [Streptomyces griseorubiginosus]|uniref:hypothetical protein n=1 Tax=Streptomyces griseorubiginosus TaxID=67304 RepID=UPI003650F604